MFSDEVAGTGDDRLHATDRMFRLVTGVPSAYFVPLPRGEYLVTLHFTKSERARPGAYVFNVFLEGTRKLESYDLSSPTSYTTADKKSFQTRVDDGLLEIEFVSETTRPRIAAIEIERLE